MMPWQMNSIPFAVKRVRRRKQRNMVALPPAEQLVHRAAYRSAREILQRDIDRGERGGENAASLHVLAPVEPLPESAALQRICSQ